MLKKTIFFLLSTAAILALTALITYKNLPDNSRRTTSSALPPQPDSSQLAAHFLPQIQAHPGLSGIHPLRDGRDAFLARLALTEAAQQTLDVGNSSVVYTFRFLHADPFWDF